MKRTRKLLAMALALMLSLSCMAMPAMAHENENEGIMPLKLVATCAICGGYAEMSTSQTSGQIRVTGCSEVDKPHYHSTIIVTKTITCENGHSVSSQPETFLGACRG